MSISEGHRRQCMPEKVAHRSQRYASHDKPGCKGMTEVVEVEVRQSCGRTGPIKAMSHIGPPMPRLIMKDPGYILEGP